MGCGCKESATASLRTNATPSGGIVEWAGFEWHGVPYPLRWWLWATRPAHPKPSSFAGCGCLVELKAALREFRRDRARG